MWVKRYAELMGNHKKQGIKSPCDNKLGVGHGWVKERFITAAPPMQPIDEEVVWRDPDGTEHRAVQQRIFVPSSVFDNPALLQNDPLYVQRLASMPEADRNALLYGDWDSFTGQVFTEWRNDRDHYEDRKNTHVIAPFGIPGNWPIWCGMDWGYSRPFSVGWYAVDPQRRLYRIREYYGCTGEPNVGVKLEPSEVARRIREIEADDPNLRGRKILRVGDPAIWGSDGTESVGALMERERVYFEKGDHARIAGKMQMHHRLAFDSEGHPMLYVFDTCRHFIRTIPALVYDDSNVEDIDTEGEDHCLIGSTLVWTDKGKKPIADLVGTEGAVLSSDGRYHAYSDVRRTQKEVAVVTVEMDDGTTVTATANHRFRLKDGTWKRLDELEEGDELWTMEE